MPVSKLFSIAREGATTDGRKIQRSWIEQMAANYDQKEYGARVNLEHFLAMHPDSTFRAYGDVVELKTEERDGKLHLLARVDATDELVELHEKRQKIYTSIELDPEFADSGEAYLVGLAMTDSPASLGTEIMSFAANAKQNPFTARKQRPENLFSEAVLADLDFSETEPKPAADTAGILDKVKSLFNKHKDTSAAEFSAFKADLESALELLTEKVIATNDSGKDAESFSQLKEAHEALQAEFSELKTQLESEPSRGQFKRAPTSGGADEELTDC